MSAAEDNDRGNAGRSAGPGDFVTRGVAAGLFGGFAFLIANMFYADAHGKPAVGPLLSISTIFHHQQMPMMSAQNVVIGLVLHISLSMLFGVVFGLAVGVLRSMLAKPMLGTPMLIVGALVYGLVLYVVNFQILARAFFGWFVNPKGPNQVFELWIHPVAYGLFLVPFFLGLSARAGAARVAAPAPESGRH